MKTVIEMAKEAGLFTHKEVRPELERFAELVRADERARMAEQPAQQEQEPICKLFGTLPVYDRAAQRKPAQQEPVAWADECRIELVNAIHFLASDFENALGAFGGDTEARRKAEGDIAHARSIASRWNWNGTSPPAQRTWVGLTDEERNDLLDTYITAEGRAQAIEHKLKEKNT